MSCPFLQVTLTEERKGQSRDISRRGRELAWDRSVPMQVGGGSIVAMERSWLGALELAWERSLTLQTVGIRVGIGKVFPTVGWGL